MNIAKVIEAGDFICNALHRETNSKVARAKGRTLWFVSAKEYTYLSDSVPLKVLPLLLLPSNLLPMLPCLKHVGHSFSTCFPCIQIIGRIINSVLFCGPKSALSISVAYLSFDYYIVESVSDWMIDWICNFLVGLFFFLCMVGHTRSHNPWKITRGRWQSRRMYWTFTNFKNFPCLVLVLTLNLCEGQPLLISCVAQWPYSITLYKNRF